MKSFKKVLKYFSVLILVLSLFGLGFTFLFAEKIEGIVLNKVNSKLKTGISVADIEFSVFANFPYASVTFSDIFIQDSNSDTLLFSKNSIIKLNVISLISGDYSVKNMEVQKGEINVKYDEKGIPNFNILKDTKKTDSDLNLDRILFTDCKLRYTDKLNDYLIKSNIENVLLSYSNNEGDHIITLEGDLFMNNLIISEDDYINEKDVFASSEITISENSIDLKSSILNINNITFDNVLFNKNNEKWKLTSKTETELDEILTTMPEKFKYMFKEHEIKGKIKADILIENDGLSEYPFCNVDFKLTESFYKSNSQDFKLSKISSEGNFNNGGNRNFKSSEFRFSNFNSIKNNGSLKGDFIFSNLDNYYLNADIYSSWELSELNNFIDDSPFHNIKGSVKGQINYKGNFSFNELMKEYIRKSEHTANLYFKNVFFNYKKSDLNFSSKKMNWEIKDHKVKIDDVINISDSEMDFDGEIINLILYILDQKEEISVKGSMKSKKINFKELFKITELNDDTEKGEFISVLPNWINCELDLNIDHLIYSDFSASSISGEVIYDNKKLKLFSEKLKMDALDGKINVSFDYFENKLHDLILKSNWEFTKIDIAKGFSSFNNFEQTFITNKNIKGIGSATMYLQSMWDKNYKFYSPSLNMNSTLKIENGELIDFEPMYELSDYVSLEELKNVKFATLENKIRIENEEIIIPKMDINSSAMSVFISGTHSFDNIMDYKVRLLLSDVLSKKSKNKSNIDKENYSINKSGKTTIQLNMEGHVDDPKVSLDKIKIKQDIFKEIKKETKEVKEIIEENILNSTKKDSSEEDEKEKEETGIELEWEDEE